MSMSEIIAATESLSSTTPATPTTSAAPAAAPAVKGSASVAATTTSVDTAATTTAASPNPASLEEARRIYLGNLPRKVKREDVTAFLDGYKFEDITIPNFGRPFRNRGIAGRNGFAFVDLSSAEEAQKALESLNEKLMGDRKVSVKLAKPIVPREPKVKTEKSEGSSESEGKPAGEAAEKKPKKKSKSKKEKKDAPPATNGETATKEATEIPAKSKTPRPKRERAPEDMSPVDSIFIRNLPHDTTKESLAEFLHKFSPIWTHVSFKYAKSNKNPARSFRQHFGFAKLKDAETQKKAIAELSGQELNGRVVRVAAVAADKPKQSEATEATSTKPADAKVEVKEVPVSKNSKATEPSKESIKTEPATNEAPAPKEVAKENVVPTKVKTEKE